MAGPPRAHLQATLRRLLPLLSWSVAAFYAALVLYWFAAVQPLYPTLAVVWTLAATALATNGALLRRAGPGTGAQLLGSVALAAVVTFASGCLVLVTGNPGLVIAQIVAVLGLALLLASRAALAGSIAGALVFLVLAARSHPAAQWPSGVIALVAASLVALAAQEMRIRLYDRVEAAHASQLDAEREAQRQKRKRHEAEATSRFLRLAAHQLGTPLTAVTIQARLLAQADLPGHHGKSAQLLDRNVDRLNHAVADILLLTQHQAGTLLLQRERVDFAQVARAEVDAVREAALQARVRAETALPGGLWVRADRAKLGTAVRKVLENAVRFTPPGGAFEVRGAADGREAVIEVMDQGPGVPEGQRAALFHPFGAAHDVMQAEGTGLGLAVASAIAQAHGGRTEYRPRDGGGSVFSIHVPLEPAGPGPPP